MLSQDDAELVVALLRKAGFTAVRSSVHVNFGPPHFDKLSACLTVVRQVLGADGNDLSQYVFVGDALNDAPMFNGFPLSVGVSNIKQYWDELPFKPAFLTERPEGAGLREVIAHLMSIRKS
jgi:hydroxymethylpyrimidine pyrophosphatase-like HAD family hydrolase